MEIYCHKKWKKESNEKKAYLEMVLQFCREFFNSEQTPISRITLLENGFDIHVDVRPWRNADDMDYADVFVFFVKKEGRLDCNCYTLYYGGESDFNDKPKKAEEMLEYIRNNGILDYMKS